MRYRKCTVLLAFAVALANCGSDAPDALTPDVTVITCSRIATPATGTLTTFEDVLPAGGTSFSKVVLTNSPVGNLSDFNESTGAFRYVAANESRLPDVVHYELRDANDQLIESRAHYLVFEPLRIMPLGDSITHGVDFFDGVDNPPVPLRVGYRKFLYDALIDAGHAIDFTGQAGQRAGFDAGLDDVDNNGYPGVDIPFIAAKVYEVLDEVPSDVILLHIGTNQTPTSAAGILEILDEIDRWTATNFPVQVLVSTLVPKRDAELQTIVDAFNNDLRQVIGLRAQSSVTLVENALALSVNDISQETVGIHPSPAGYQRMARTWLSSLTASILTAPVNDCGNV